MKNIIISIVAAALMLSSCNILDQYPHDAVSRDSVSETDLELLFVGLYNMSQYKPTFQGYFQNDITGGDFVGGGSTIYPDAQTMIKNFVHPSVNWMNGPYTGYYALLYQINVFIALAQSAEQTDNVKEMLGVAYYFRALTYYNLTSKYREVPLMRVTSTEALPKSSEAECWALVNEDIQNAIAMCPTYTTKNYVSVQAAKALAARIYLAQGNKELAGAYADELMGDPLFELSENFDALFRRGDNKEEIFTFSNLTEDNGIAFAGNFVQPATTYVPSPAVIALYSASDRRADMSAYQDGDETILNKYVSKSTSDPIIISRLAEMYLISAECKGLAGGGLEILNSLRAVRGLGAVSPAPKNEEEFIDAILAERRLEFLGEGFRWFDLVRTGRLTTTLGLDEKYTVFPLPTRELDLNGNLKQHILWQ